MQSSWPLFVLTSVIIRFLPLCCLPLNLKLLRDPLIVFITWISVELFIPCYLLDFVAIHRLQGVLHQQQACWGNVEQSMATLLTWEICSNPLVLVSVTCLLLRIDPVPELLSLFRGVMLNSAMCFKVHALWHVRVRANISHQFYRPSVNDFICLTVEEN